MARLILSFMVLVSSGVAQGESRVMCQEAFAKTISEKNKELSQLILDGKVSLYFFKDPHGFDDQILPVVNESTTVNSQMLSADPSKKVDVFHPVNEVTAWSLFGTEKQEEKSNEAQ